MTEALASDLLRVASLSFRERAAILDEATKSASAELEREQWDAERAVDTLQAKRMAFWARLDVAANREREVEIVRGFLDGPADGRFTVSAVEPAAMLGDPVPDEFLVRETVVPCMVRFMINDYYATAVPDFNCFASLASPITLEYFNAAALTEESKRIIAFSGQLPMRTFDEQCRECHEKNGFGPNPRMEVHFGDCRVYGYTRKPSVRDKLWTQGMSASARNPATFTGRGVELP